MCYLRHFLMELNIYDCLVETFIKAGSSLHNFNTLNTQLYNRTTLAT